MEKPFCVRVRRAGRNLFSGRRAPLAKNANAEANSGAGIFGRRATAQRLSCSN